MARGGRREGAGRKAKPKGERRVSFTWEKVAQAIELSPEKTPLAHLLAFMQNEDMKETLRLQAAIAAAPYMHPKLSSIEVKTDQAAPMKAQSEIGLALASLAELMRQRKTIDGDVVDVDEKPTGRGDKVARVTSDSVARSVRDVVALHNSDSVARDTMARQTVDVDADPVPLPVETVNQGGDDGQ